MHDLHACVPRVGRQRGAATVLTAATAVLAAMVALAVVHGGQRIIEGARARTAADAAALAGVEGGRAEAERLAVANGGRLDRYTVSGGDVLVSVRVGDRTATARARALAVPAAPVPNSTSTAGPPATATVPDRVGTHGAPARVRRPASRTLPP